MQNLLPISPPLSPIVWARCPGPRHTGGYASDAQTSQASRRWPSSGRSTRISEGKTQSQTSTHGSDGTILFSLITIKTLRMGLQFDKKAFRFAIGMKWSHLDESRCYHDEHGALWRRSGAFGAALKVPEVRKRRRSPAKIRQKPLWRPRRNRMDLMERGSALAGGRRRA